MKKAFGWSIRLLVITFIVVYLVFRFVRRGEQEDQIHFERGETELRVSNLSGATLTLFLSGKSPSDTLRITAFDGSNIWLPAGNYFLKADGTKFSYIPISLTGYHCGPDEDGSFNVTIRPLPKAFPPRLNNTLPEFLYIPGGSSLLGGQVESPRTTLCMAHWLLHCAI